MDRFIAKDANLNNYDLKTLNLQNAYIADCSLVGAKLGDCSYATFYNCDLTNADFTEAILTGADFQSCKLDGIKLVDSVTAWQRVVGKQIISVVGFMPTHCHESYAYAIEQAALKLPKGQLKDRALECANDIRTRKDLCWEEFAKLWDLKWFPDQKLMEFLITAHKADPRLWIIFRDKFKDIYAKKYPRIKETLWQDSL